MSEENRDILRQKEKANFWYKQKKSQSLRDIYRKIYGNDYPEELNLFHGLKKQQKISPS